MYEYDETRDFYSWESQKEIWVESIRLEDED